MTDEAPKAESLYDMFGSDESTSENGKWFKFGKTIEFKIRRFKSKKSRKVRDALEAPYKRATKFGSQLPDDVQNEITIQHIADGIIADWKGVVDKQGNPVKYSAAAAVALLTDLPDLRDSIAELSLNLDNFRDDDKEEVKGN